MNINIFAPGGHCDHGDHQENRLARLEARVRLLEVRMGSAESEILELETALEQANQVTNEIAADVATLMAQPKAPTQAQWDDLKGKVAQHVAKLQQVAAEYTPEGSGEPTSPPAEPPVEGDGSVVGDQTEDSSGS